MSESFPWKRLIVSGLAIGTGIALTMATILGVIYWYQTLPQSWNAEAIKATFDRVDTEGQDNTILLQYVLENHTRKDYRIENVSHIILMGKLKTPESLISEESWAFRLDFPIFIPPGERLRIDIHCPVPFPEKPKQNATLEERREYRNGVGQFLGREIGNLDGFVVYDKINYYRINFPRGW